MNLRSRLDYNEQNLNLWKEKAEYNTLLCSYIRLNS